MKHRTDTSRIAIPFIKYTSDHDSLGESPPSEYSSAFISRHGTHTSSQLFDPRSRHYLSTEGYSSAEHGSGQMSYPESSQRTVVSEDIKPCISYTDEEHGQATIDTRLPFSTNDTFHLPSARERILSPPVVANMYHSSPVVPSSHQAELHNSHMVGNIPHPSPRNLQSPLYLLSSPTLEKTELLDRYNSPSQSGSGVGTDAASYANFDVEPPHDLGPPVCSPARSSIPMCNMGWSSVTASGTYDRAQVPEPNVCVIQNSGSSISAYQPSEHLEQQSSQPASSSSLPANETVKKKKSKMHQSFSCGFEGCSRTFTVRSNAKRHLRTHGVETVSSRQTSSTPYSIGFDTPTIVPPTTMHETATTSYKLRWMPPSLSTRTNATSLVSVSDDESSDDEYGHGLGDQSKSVITLPHLPVVSSSSECDPQGPLKERNSYIETSSYIYHFSQVSESLIFLI
ncbi:hypothetical protein C0989_007274 [Termitomyces sp. Mn162]|nr:hypothetical protein C0989_007274 [Termitomyces sp. Mn162]